MRSEYTILAQEKCKHSHWKNDDFVGLEDIFLSTAQRFQPNFTVNCLPLSLVLKQVILDWLD